MDDINDIKIKEEQLEFDLIDHQSTNTDDESEDNNGQSICESMGDINNITIKEEQLEWDPYGNENSRIDEFEDSDLQSAQESQAEPHSAPDEGMKKNTYAKQIPRPVDSTHVTQTQSQNCKPDPKVGITGDTDSDNLNIIGTTHVIISDKNKSIVKNNGTSKKLGKKPKVQLGEPPYECPVCPTIVKSKYTFLRHLKRHEPKSENDKEKEDAGTEEDDRYKCTQCKKTYIYEVHYERHLQSHRNGKIASKISKPCISDDHDKNSKESDASTRIRKLPPRIILIDRNSGKKREQKPELIASTRKAHHRNAKSKSNSKNVDNVSGDEISMASDESDYQISSDEDDDVSTDGNFVGRMPPKKKLKVHVEGEPPFQCPKCPSMINNKYNYLRHLKRHADKEKAGHKFPCTECSAGFRFESSLLKHLRSHGHVVVEKKKKKVKNQEDFPFKCSECQKTYKFESYYQLHLKSHKEALERKMKAEAERKAENQFYCSQCPLSFKYEHNYEHHLRQHRFSTTHERTRYCRKCDIQFENTKQKRLHVLNFHRDAQYECRFCDMQFRDLKLLKKHLKQHNCEDETINAGNPKICAPDQNGKETEVETSGKTCTTPIDQARSETPVAVEPTALRIKEEPQEVSDPVDTESSKEPAVPDSQISIDAGDGVATDHREYDMNSMYNEAKNRFECNKCPVACKTEYSFKRHLIAHKRGLKGKDRYYCNQCPLSFSRGRLFNRHLQTHPIDPRIHNLTSTVRPSSMSSTRDSTKHVIRESICKECNITFDTVKQRIAHWVAVHRVRRCVCNICNAKFYTQSKLAKHIKTHQPRNKEKSKANKEKSKRKPNESTIVKTRCRYCLVMINSKTMENHIKNCGPRDCCICDEKFARYHQLTYHMKKKHPNGFFKCPVCPRMYVDELVRNKHSISCAQYLFTCEVCGLRLRTSYGLRSHKANIHNIRAPSKTAPVVDNKQIVLEDSGINIKTEMILEETTLQPQDHQLKPVTMNDGKKREYACPICRKIFPSPYKRNNHKLVEHQVPRFKCNECGKWYHIKSALNKHIIAHNNIKQRKLLSESNKKPHTCPICKHVVPTKAHLRRHMRTYHTERKFKCHICEADFHVNNRLLLHMKIHENDTGSRRKGRRRKKRFQEMKGESIDVQPKTRRTKVK